MLLTDLVVSMKLLIKCKLWLMALNAFDRSSNIIVLMKLLIKCELWLIVSNAFDRSSGINEPSNQV